MVEPQEPPEPEQTTDPAALAFEALREEVALARRAVAGLAAERADSPDYSETLAQIMRASTATASRLKTFSELPILHATAHDWAHAIEQTSALTRQADREALAILYRQLRQVAEDMAATSRSARTAIVQCQWLLWCLAGGMLAGTLLGVFAIAPLVHAL